VGICGTDIHYYTHAAFGAHVLNSAEPFLFGHECSGTVEEVGADVKDFKAGDKVMMEPNNVCGKCDDCLTGYDNRCENNEFVASFTRRQAFPAAICNKLPDSVTLDEGAMIEPLTCAFHGCRRANVQGGQKVLICGSGAIGALSLLCAKAMGAMQIVATDISDHRLKMIKELGADFTVNVANKSPKEAAEAVKQALGSAPDTALECTGFGVSIETAIWALKSGGTLAIVGMGANRGDLPVMECIRKELNIFPSLKYQRKPEIPLVIQMVASRQIDLRKLTTAHFKLEEIEQALKKTMSAEVVKVLVHC